MPKVKIEKKGPQLMRVYVDERMLQFEDGEAELELAPGYHVLNWFVRGEPGVQYTVSITAADGTKFVHNAALDSAMKDAGLRWFEVNP